MGRVIIVISIDDPEFTTMYQQTCQIHDDTVALIVIAKPTN
jgi:UDP-N-acetyl-D-mannosaminuronic acid transferase (WecB/TagA/CpsF family)